MLLQPKHTGLVGKQDSSHYHIRTLFTHLRAVEWRFPQDSGCRPTNHEADISVLKLLTSLHWHTKNVSFTQSAVQSAWLQGFCTCVCVFMYLSEAVVSPKGDLWGILKEYGLYFNLKSKSNKYIFLNCLNTSLCCCLHYRWVAFSPLLYRKMIVFERG